MTLASDIKPGQKIILGDGKTVVTVTEVIPSPEIENEVGVENNKATVNIYWETDGERRHMIYLTTTKIEIAP